MRTVNEVYEEIIQYVNEELTKQETVLENLKSRRAVMKPEQFDREVAIIIGHVRAFSMVTQKLKTMHADDDETAFIWKGKSEC